MEFTIDRDTFLKSLSHANAIIEKKTIPSIAVSDTYSEIANKIFKNASIRSLKFADMLSKSLQLTKLVKLI